ncbi:MAG: cytochrome b5 [Proteobacteria bacterium]|nr:cytochrome b5 [Pseudomonadota bacterium]MBU1455794.1 cytochrome b5 [Pseudomonadota bacterium]
MEKFDKATLVDYDGAKGVYVAYKGRVYDVSGSKLWKTGEHMKRHHAGTDLTSELAGAPHGPEMLERFPQVGVLETGEKTEAEPHLPAWLAWLFQRWPMLERHPHPMLVHFPIAFLSAAPMFALLFLLTGWPGFDVTTLCCLGGGVLMIPFAVATGFLTWWVNYMAQPMLAVRIKIGASGCLFVLGCAVFFWRLAAPDLLLTPGTARTLYLLLLCSLIPLVATLGWFGASITFPVQKD